MRTDEGPNAFRIDHTDTALLATDAKQRPTNFSVCQKVVDSATLESKETGYISDPPVLRHDVGEVTGLGRLGGQDFFWHGLGVSRAAPSIPKKDLVVNYKNL